MSAAKLAADSEVAERALRTLGALQTALGLAVLLSPRRGGQIIELRSRRMTGEAVFGWRLFALRQLLLGAGVATGAEPVRPANWLLQPADLALFIHAYRKQSIPRRAALSSMALAASANGTLVLARRAAPLSLSRQRSPADAVQATLTMGGNPHRGDPADAAIFKSGCNPRDASRP